MGNAPLTWDDVESFDDIVLQAEKEILFSLGMPLKQRCKHLKKEGDWFYYCGKNMPEVKERTPSPVNPLYQRNVSITEIQLYCTGDWEVCSYYKGEQER